MSEKTEYPMFAPCAMNCSVCYVHLRDKKTCSGCMAEDGSKPSSCETCAIKLCTLEKGLAYCFECSEFPCKRIKYLEKSYKKRYNTGLIENSHFVKNNGFAQFFEKEKIRWSCPDCNGTISLHDKICSECGRKS